LIGYIKAEQNCSSKPACTSERYFNQKQWTIHFEESWMFAKIA